MPLPPSPGGLWGDRQLGLRVAVPSEAAWPHWAGPGLAFFLTRTENADKTPAWQGVVDTLLLKTASPTNGFPGRSWAPGSTEALCLVRWTLARGKDHSFLTEAAPCRQATEPWSRGPGSPGRLGAGDPGRVPGAAMRATATGAALRQPPLPSLRTREPQKP